MKIKNNKKLITLAILAMVGTFDAGVSLSGDINIYNKGHSSDKLTLAKIQNDPTKAAGISTKDEISGDVEGLNYELQTSQYDEALKTMSVFCKDGFLNRISSYFKIWNFQTQKEVIKKIATYLGNIGTNGKPDSNKLSKLGFKSIDGNVLEDQFLDTLKSVALTKNDQFGWSFNAIEAKYNIDESNLPSAILYWACKNDAFRKYLAYSFAMDENYKHFATEKYFPLDKEFIVALNKFTKNKKAILKEEDAKEEDAIISSTLDEIVHNGYTFESDTEKNREILEEFLEKNYANKIWTAKSFFHYLVSGNRFSPHSSETKIKSKDIIPALNSLGNDGKFFSVKYSDDIQGIPYSYEDSYYATYFMTLILKTVLNAS